ncbi:MAG: DUF5655 domain-containing protein [Minicystis sp.]
MSTVEKAREAQLENIQARTGKTLDQIYAIIRKGGLTKHGEIRDQLKRDLALGHGDANALAHAFFNAAGEHVAPAAGVAAADILGEIYAGPKADLRPIHDKLMMAIGKFGPFEVSPKKGYVSLRRTKQFSMIGPTTKTRVEVGLNMKDIEPTARLLKMPAGGMCQYKVNVTDAKEVDKELIAWIRKAYDGAG